VPVSNEEYYERVLRRRAAVTSYTLLPEPEPRPAPFRVISVDDHLIEPADIFDGRLPSRFADVAPRLVADESGRESWLLEDKLMPVFGMDSCVGRPAAEWSMAPLRHDEMRPGSWDINHRIADMDLNGIDASLNFPSLWTGFAGSAFTRMKDADLALALVRAWNDWHLEVWAGAYPGRIIPLQVTYLLDPEIAADEVRRNAERGFRAVTFSENPTGQGLPSIHSGHWDPLFAACEETGTVLCLHTGSSGHTTETSEDAPFEVNISLFPTSGIVSAADWIWSRVPVRFPNLKIALSEGGVGWLPLAIDWLDHTNRKHDVWTGTWRGIDLRPSEVLLRNFWFCTIDEPLGLRAVLHQVPQARVMVEVDYPHADSSWPDTQELLARLFDGLDGPTIEAVSHGHAAELFRWPLREPATTSKPR
jgi:predicted TIM-barrel fold metal-dependent hydrolase